MFFLPCVLFSSLISQIAITKNSVWCSAWSWQYSKFIPDSFDIRYHNTNFPDQLAIRILTSWLHYFSLELWNSNLMPEWRNWFAITTVCIAAASVVVLILNVNKSAFDWSKRVNKNSLDSMVIHVWVPTMVQSLLCSVLMPTKRDSRVNAHKYANTPPHTSQAGVSTPVEGVGNGEGEE